MHTPTLDWLTTFVLSTRATRIRLSMRVFRAIQREVNFPDARPSDHTSFMGIPVEFKA